MIRFVDLPYLCKKINLNYYHNEKNLFLFTAMRGLSWC